MIWSICSIHFARTGPRKYRFPIAKGFVAGCLVVEGRVVAGATGRNGEVVAEQKIDSPAGLRTRKSSRRTECGIHLENTNDYKEGDLIEIYEIR